MINIFNLFLFLTAIWAVLLFAFDSFSTSYMVFGMFCAFITTLISWKLKLINKNFNFLFLNFGFYKHFFLVFFFSLFRSIFYLIKLVLLSKETSGYILEITPKKTPEKSDLMLFVATLTFIFGVSYIGTKKGAILIYVVDKDFFNEDRLKKIYDNISQINDDRLV